MAQSAVAQLFRAAQHNLELRDRLNTAPNLDEFVKMAETFGYRFTVQEWQEMTQFTVEELDGELSEIPGL